MADRTFAVKVWNVERARAFAEYNRKVETKAYNGQRCRVTTAIIVARESDKFKVRIEPGPRGNEKSAYEVKTYLGGKMLGRYFAGFSRQDAIMTPGIGTYLIPHIDMTVDSLAQQFSYTYNRSQINVEIFRGSDFNYEQPNFESAVNSTAKIIGLKDGGVLPYKAFVFKIRTSKLLRALAFDVLEEDLDPVPDAEAAEDEDAEPDGVARAVEARSNVTANEDAGEEEEIAEENAEIDDSTEPDEQEDPDFGHNDSDDSESDGEPRVRAVVLPAESVPVTEQELADIQEVDQRLRNRARQANTRRNAG